MKKNVVFFDPWHQVNISAHSLKTDFGWHAVAFDNMYVKYPKNSSLVVNNKVNKQLHHETGLIRATTLSSVRVNSTRRRSTNITWYRSTGRRVMHTSQRCSLASVLLSYTCDTSSINLETTKYVRKYRCDAPSTWIVSLPVSYATQYECRLN